MIKHIKVEWIEHKHVIPPEKYTSCPTKEDYDSYIKALKEYDQPYRDSECYHVDENGEETVKWYKIDYLRNEVIALLKDRHYKLTASKKQVNKQLDLFQWLNI